MKNKEAGPRVKKLRKALDLGQEDFARLLGVAFQTVNRWENGLAAPSGLAESLLECLAKIVAAGQARELLQDFRSGEFGGGSPKAYHRIFSLAFGIKTPTAAHR